MRGKNTQGVFALSTEVDLFMDLQVVKMIEKENLTISKAVIDAMGLSQCVKAYAKMHLACARDARREGSHQNWLHHFQVANNAIKIALLDSVKDERP